MGSPGCVENLPSHVNIRIGAILTRFDPEVVPIHVCSRCSFFNDLFRAGRPSNATERMSGIEIV